MNWVDIIICCHYLFIIVRLFRIRPRFLFGFYIFWISNPIKLKKPTKTNKMAEERMTEDISINNNEIQRSESSDRGDMEIYPFPAITKSKVWDFYGFYKVKEGPPLRENLDMTKAVCRLCLKKYINKGW